MAVTSTTFAGVNVFQFSGAVTDAEIKTAWASLVVNGTYVLNRAIYLDATADLTAVTGGFMVDFGTQVLPAIILHTSRDKSKSIFNNFIFIQRTGLIVNQRSGFVATTNGTTISNAGSGLSIDGLAQNGGAFVYAVPGNPGGSDPRYLNEMAFAGTEGVTIMSQEFTEQELQICVSASTTIKGIKYEKAYGFPQIGTPAGSVNVVVYRSTQNTQSLDAGGLIPIRLFPYSNRYASACYVDSYVTRNGGDINTRLANAFGSNASNPACFVVLNNYTRESWFGASKTVIPITSWSASNFVYGGVLKKLQFVNGDGGVVRCYDSRSTTASQKCKFAETGFFDFTDTNLAPTTDSTGKISLVHIGAIASGATAAITRYTGQKYTFQKFGYRVLVGTPDMTSGDNDLSAFTPISLTAQDGISRPLATINAATQINNFQELLEELHVLAIGLSGSQSYSGAFGGNLFNYDGAVLTSSFATVNIDATASSKITFNSATNTLTIKSSVLTSALDVQRWNNSAGAVNLLNGAIIQGVYQDNTGTSTVLTISGFDANSSVYIEDQNAVQKFYSADATGTVTYYIPPTGTGSWYYAVEKYGNQRQSDFFTFNGGFREIVVKAIPDTGLTVLNSATVGAYTELENPDKVYDYVAFKRLSVPFISYGQIVFKDGTALDLIDADMVIDQSATQVADFDYDNKILTVKSSSMVTGVTYNLIKTTPPKTIETASTEVISVNIEDANGDSSVNIQGGSGNFTLWKITNATSEDDFATGTNLGTVTNEIYRFLSDPGFKIVIRDNTTGFRQVVPMDKGNYTRGLFFGDQVQLAQSQEVSQINTKVDILSNDIEGIKGTGFTVNTDSLKNISDKVQSLENTDLTGIALEASVQEVLTAVENIEVDNAAIADAVWDEVLTGGTHNIGGSAGRRLRTLADTVILKEGVGTDMVNSGGVGLLTLEVGTTTQCIYQAIRVNDMVRFIREYNSATRVATMDKPWCEVTAGNVEYTLFNLRESTEGITVADIEASTILAKEATLEEIKTDIANIDVDLTGVALEATSQEILTGLGNIEVDKEAIAEEVWLQQPDRLKNVATIQTTGDQIATI